jgi:hypothetical protein
MREKVHHYYVYLMASRTRVLLRDDERSWKAGVRSIRVGNFRDSVISTGAIAWSGLSDFSMLEMLSRGRGRLRIGGGSGFERSMVEMRSTAGPSTSLRFGRDDKFSFTGQDDKFLFAGWQ